MVKDYKGLKAKNPKKLQKPKNNKTFNETVQSKPKKATKDYKLLI